MKAARIVFPKFCFGKTPLQEAEKLAQMGVGGFCLSGATAQETHDFIQYIQEISPYDKLLFCADIAEDLSEIITDAPRLPANARLNKDSDDAYQKGFLTARMARSIGINWVLAPVIDLGYTTPTFSDKPMEVVQLAGDYIAGLSNGGVLNCLKYFPGVSGVLKTLAQMEDAEFVPYKHMFRRADAIMPSDMTFPNIDNDNQAMLSDKVLLGVLKKRLNYKGCIMSFPLCDGYLRYEEGCAIKMLHAKVENLLAPKNPFAVIEAIEREVNRGFLTDEIIHAISNHELFLSKITAAPEILSIEAAFELARKYFHN